MKRNKPGMPAIGGLNNQGALVDNMPDDPPCACQGGKAVSLLDGLRAENQQLMQHKGWQDLNVVLDAYRHLERFRGRALVVPETGGDEEAWRRFHQKAGCPDHPQSYQMDLPDELLGALAPDNSYLDEIRQLSHDLGLLPHQARRLADKLLRLGLRHQVDARQQQLRDRRERRQHSLRDLEQEWGPQDGEPFRANMALARRCYEHLADENLTGEATDIGWMEDGFGPSSPAIVKAMANIGRALFAEGDYAEADSNQVNPFTTDGFNLTLQSQMMNDDPVRARALIRRAGLDPARYNMRP